MLKYLEELNSFLDEYNLSKEDICLVGGSVFAANSLRVNNDIDIMIKPSKFNSLKGYLSIDLLDKWRGYIAITENLDIYINRYKIIELKDEDVFLNKYFYCLLYTSPSPRD